MRDVATGEIDAFFMGIVGFILIIFPKGFDLEELMYFGFLCFGGALGSCHVLLRLCLRGDDGI